MFRKRVYGIHGEVPLPAFEVWNRRYNYHRPYGDHDRQPPAPGTPARVNNVVAPYRMPWSGESC